MRARDWLDDPLPFWFLCSADDDGDDDGGGGSSDDDGGTDGGGKDTGGTDAGGGDTGGSSDPGGGDAGTDTTDTGDTSSETEKGDQSSTKGEQTSGFGGDTGKDTSPAAGDRGEQTSGFSGSDTAGAASSETDKGDRGDTGAQTGGVGGGGATDDTSHGLVTDSARSALDSAGIGDLVPAVGTASPASAASAQGVGTGGFSSAAEILAGATPSVEALTANPPDTPTDVTDTPAEDPFGQLSGGTPGAPTGTVQTERITAPGGDQNLAAPQPAGGTNTTTVAETPLQDISVAPTITPENFPEAQPLIDPSQFTDPTFRPPTQGQDNSVNFPAPGQAPGGQTINFPGPSPSPETVVVTTPASAAAQQTTPAPGTTTPAATTTPTDTFRTAKPPGEIDNTPGAKATIDAINNNQPAPGETTPSPISGNNAPSGPAPDGISDGATQALNNASTSGGGAALPTGPQITAESLINPIPADGTTPNPAPDGVTVGGLPDPGSFPGPGGTPLGYFDAQGFFNPIQMGGAVPPGGVQIPGFTRQVGNPQQQGDGAAPLGYQNVLNNAIDTGVGDGGTA